jgi:hypothetical protein
LFVVSEECCKIVYARDFILCHQCRRFHISH